ncbi:MAG: ABC transporter ATP-binding protein [Proteobacteria bacterium]|nr:ABC transporter ATP-binding protein [Pseudomonadota bacterium]
MSRRKTAFEEERLGAFDMLGLLRRVITFAHGQGGLLTLCLLGTLVLSGAQACAPLLVRAAVDGFMDPSAASPPDVALRVRGVTWLAAAYVGLLALTLIVSYAIIIGLNLVGQRVVKRLRTAVWTHLHRLPIRYFDLNPVGRLVTRVANDTNAIAELFTSVLTSGLSDALTFVGVSVILLRLDAALALRVMGLFIPLAALVMWFKTVSQPLQRRIRELLARVNAFFQENVQGIAVVKSFTAQARQIERFHQLNAETYRTEMRNVHVFAVFRPLVSACSTLGLAIVLWQGGAAVLDGRLSLGTLVAFLMYVRMLFAPVDDLAEKFNVMQSALVASERLLRILDTAPEPAPSLPGPSRAEGRIRFDRVSFSYDPDKPVLRDVSFEVAPGEIVALVGPTGSGKSTIAALLLGFYRVDPDGGGRILLDDRPIDEWDVQSLRRQFGFVQQELFLFSTDLRRNITLHSQVPDDRLARAIELSQATRVAERFEDGIDHPVEERGASLSQGERQLLSFARALVTDPPVLILDEATASIDSKTEALIQTALHRAIEGRTALIIAHRLSTVQEADRVIVLRKGQIVEQGSHAVLMAANGLYAHMFRTQMTDAH